MSFKNPIGENLGPRLTSENPTLGTVPKVGGGKQETICVEIMTVLILVVNSPYWWIKKQQSLPPAFILDPFRKSESPGLMQKTTLSEQYRWKIITVGNTKNEFPKYKHEYKRMTQENDSNNLKYSVASGSVFEDFRCIFNEIPE